MDPEMDAAVAAARAAGEVLRRGYRTELQVRYKGTVDLVTEIDDESERVIIASLRAAFPRYGVLAEEGGGTAGAEDARWVIDPVDGTTNYAHGFPFFAVSIALERAGRVELGVVLDPLRDELYAARRGGGATCNGETLRVSTTDTLGRALVATGFPYERERVPDALALWGRLSLLCQGMRRAGAAALDLCYVASGKLDGYYERGIKAWDVAAGGLILAEAGGTLTDYAGAPFRIDAGEVVSTNGTALHAALVAETGRLPEE